MTNKRKQKWQWLGLILLGLAVGMIAKGYLVKAASEPPQDTLILERRLSTLEQRLYGIESNISRLEQQLYTAQRSTPSPVSPQASRDPEVSLLRSEVELLKGRVRELECGVVHLDEDRKAQMVSNLLVLLCGERATQPIVNAGKLY